MPQAAVPAHFKIVLRCSPGSAPSTSPANRCRLASLRSSNSSGWKRDGYLFQDLPCISDNVRLDQRVDNKITAFRNSRNAATGSTRPEYAGSRAPPM